MTENDAIQRIQKQAMLPLFYHDRAEVCIKTTTTLYEAGVRCIEFYNRGDNALSNFKQLVKERDKNFKEMALGVGTIKTGDDAGKFIGEGADFLVSPVFDAAVCDIAYMQKMLWVPGCMTPTEIHIAEQAGCVLVKLFPGNVLGPGYVKSIKPLFRNTSFMMTGGVQANEENIREWFEAGVSCVGLGSNLISNQLLQAEDYPAIRKKTSELLGIVKKIKK